MYLHLLPIQRSNPALLRRRARWTLNEKIMPSRWHWTRCAGAAALHGEGLSCPVWLSEVVDDERRRQQSELSKGCMFSPIFVSRTTKTMLDYTAQYLPVGHSHDVAYN